ncbi:MAG: ribonuclease III [Chloroflexi bacterium]|nr:ribonuclease III [Chloroflexota bacterium]MBV9547696.1 ribonuclease III [Chloroflexota bacterium]
MPESLPAAPSLHRTLRYNFTDPGLLEQALVHTSYVNERPGRGLESNERLEFLGDAVLGVVVAHRLYELRPHSPEGELTVLRAWLVRQSTLARWARQIGIGPLLLLGRGEARGGGRDRPALLSRGFEAVVGSIYLDGGLSAAREVLLSFIDRELESGFSPQRVVDAKSRLQQVTQARFEATPVYSLVEHSGPGHAPVFVVEVRAGPEIVARGAGHSKRAAQQAAAHAALQQMDVSEGYEEPIEDLPRDADQYG